MNTTLISMYSLAPTTLAVKVFDDLVKTLDDIRKAVESWTVEHQGVKVYVKDFDEAVHERQTRWTERVLEARLEELRREQKASGSANGQSAGRPDPPLAETR